MTALGSTASCLLSRNGEKKVPVSRENVGLMKDRIISSAGSRRAGSELQSMQETLKISSHRSPKAPNAENVWLNIFILFSFPLCERRHFFRHFGEGNFLTSPRCDFQARSQILMSRTATYECWASFDAISLLTAWRSARKLNKSTCYKPSTLKNVRFRVFSSSSARFSRRNFPGLKIDENFAQTRPEGTGTAAGGRGAMAKALCDSRIHHRGDFEVRV